MKLFGSTEKITDETNDVENALEGIKVLLIQYNLAHNQYERKSEVLYIFIPNKSYSCLLN